MVGIGKTVRWALVALAVAGLGACTSPLLTRINEEIAKAPFTGTSYAFVRQWGNSAPEYSFNRPIVKTDTAGYVYVADSSFRIRKFTAAGVLQSTVSGVSTRGVSARIYDMAFDSSGNMYVTTNDTSAVQKYDVSGNLLLQWGSATDLYPASGGVALSQPQGIAVDAGGNVYVVDRGNHRVVKFTTAGVFAAEWGRQATDLYPPSTGATLNGPAGIAADAVGNVYVVDGYNHRVVKFTSAGTYVTDWGGQATDLYPPSTGTVMSYPWAVALGVSGSSPYVYVSDSSNDRIIRFTTSGTYSVAWGSSAQFSSPESLAADAAGYVYVADGSSISTGRIQKFDASSTPSLSATWESGGGAADGLVTTPWGVAFDPSGNVVVSEMANGRLQKFDPSGTFVAKWGTSGSGAGQFGFPAGIAIKADGTIYVAEFVNSRYQVLDSSGASTATVGSAGAGSGFFDSPIGIAYDASGNLYVCDAGNALVQVFSSSGYFLRQWGSAGTGDGQFTAGAIYGIAVDQAGFVYVSDYLANRVQKFDLMGAYISTIGAFGGGDGQFNAPIGLAVDAVGNLYVCDMMNHRVQKFDSAGNFLAKFGGPGAGNRTFGWPAGVAVNASGSLVVTDYAGSLVQEFEPTF